MSEIILTKGVAPSIPSTGKITIYVKSDGNVYLMDDAGRESLIVNLSIPILGFSGADGEDGEGIPGPKGETGETGPASTGKQTVWIPAGAMMSRTTNGAASGSAEMATNKNMVKTLDFDTATQEFAQFDVRMPKSWDEGTITFIPIWSHAATATNFGVVWGLDAVAISDGDALDVAFGTAQTSSDTGGATNTLYHGPESAAVTISGTPAAGDLVQFRVHRDPANGSDTMAIDARLHGVALFYTTDAVNDA